MNNKIARLTMVFSLCLWALFSVSGKAQQPATGNGKNTELYAQLPDEIKKQGKIIAVSIGAEPPFIIINGGKEEGVVIDLVQALSQQLGVTIEQRLVADFAGLLSGVQSGRYALAMGPVADLPERHGKMDFVDYIYEYGVIAIPKDNPGKINSIQDVCGKRASALTGGAGIDDLEEQSLQCVKQGKPAITIQSYPDISTVILAVRSGRSDAAFHSAATMSFYLQQSPGKLELVADGLGSYYQGIALPKNSPLTPVIHAAMQKLFENGTYAALMKKWHIEDNMLPVTGINLSAKKAVKSGK